MPDDPIRPGQLPSDDDFAERFRRVELELEGLDADSDPLSADYEKRLRTALDNLNDPQFELSDEQIAQRAAQMHDEVTKAAQAADPNTGDIEARLDALHRKT